MRNILSGMLTF